MLLSRTLCLSDCFAPAAASGFVAPLLPPGRDNAICDAIDTIVRVFQIHLLLLLLLLLLCICAIQSKYKLVEIRRTGNCSCSALLRLVEPVCGAYLRRGNK